MSLNGLKDNLSKRDKRIIDKEVSGVIDFFKERYKDPEELAERIKDFQPALTFFIDFMVANRDGMTLEEYKQEMKTRLRSENG